MLGSNDCTLTRNVDFLTAPSEQMWCPRAWGEQYWRKFKHTTSCKISWHEYTAFDPAEAASVSNNLDTRRVRMLQVSALSVGRATLHPCSIQLEGHGSLKHGLAPPSYNCGWKHRLPTSRVKKLFTGLSTQCSTASEQLFSMQDGRVKFSGFLQAWKETDLLHRSSWGAKMTDESSLSEKEEELSD